MHGWGSHVAGTAWLRHPCSYYEALDQVVAGEIVIDAEPVPLAEVGKTWAQPDDGRRVVFVP